jgi:hypothetical protein
VSTFSLPLPATVSAGANKKVLLYHSPSRADLKLAVRSQPNGLSKKMLKKMSENYPVFINNF